MTLARLKRIELITVIVITILLTLYGSGVGWLIYTLAAGGFIGVENGAEFSQLKSVKYIPNFTPLIYGVLSVIFAPVMLFIIRNIARKNIAALALFLASLPSTILLFGVPVTVFAFILLLYLAGIRSSFELNVGVGIFLGIIFSLIFSLLASRYITHRNRVIRSKGA